MGDVENLIVGGVLDTAFVVCMRRKNGENVLFA